MFSTQREKVLKDGVKHFMADPDFSKICFRYLFDSKGPEEVKRERARWTDRVQQSNGCFLDAFDCWMYAHWAIGAAPLHRVLVISFMFAVMLLSSAEPWRTNGAGGRRGRPEIWGRSPATIHGGVVVEMGR